MNAPTKRVWPWIILALIGLPTLAVVLLDAARRPAEIGKVSTAEKRAFLAMLAKLPTRGEFFTEEAIQKAGPYTRVLLALTQVDVVEDKDHDLYPILALSSGLCEHPEHREFGVKHFTRIAHPTIKLFWAVLLFDKDESTPEIADYLRAALQAEPQRETLSELLGPEFEEFERRVKKSGK